MTPTQYALDRILNAGIVKTICQNLICFKVSQDKELESALNLKSKSYEIFPELKGVHLLLYNYLFQSLHTLDLILNLCTTKAQVVSFFNLDNLQQFKPIIEILVILLTSKHKEAEDQTLKMTAERIKSFFTAVKRKLSMHP